MEGPKLRQLLDRRLLQHQYLDDSGRFTPIRLVVVASMDLCLDWLLHLWLLCLLDRSDRCHVSH